MIREDFLEEVVFELDFYVYMLNKWSIWQQEQQDSWPQSKEALHCTTLCLGRLVF